MNSTYIHLDDERMDIVVGAERDRGHPAELQSLLLSSDDVEKRRRDRRQRFPDDDPQLNRQGVRKEKNHTSNQLKIMALLQSHQIYSSAGKANILKNIPHLKKPGKKADLGGQVITLPSPSPFVFTYT